MTRDVSSETTCTAMKVRYIGTYLVLQLSEDWFLVMIRLLESIISHECREDYYCRVLRR